VSDSASAVIIPFLTNFKTREAYFRGILAEGKRFELSDSSI
jgi:hypothetical protein